MKLVPYRHGAQAFQRFVFSTFCNGSGVPRSELEWMLKNGAHIVVAVGDSVDPEKPDAEDPFFGWAGEHEGSVIWAYTKPMVFETPDGGIWRNRGNHLAKRMLAELGFTKDKPVPVLYDTIAARKWAQRGWQIVLPEERKESA